MKNYSPWGPRCGRLAAAAPRFITFPGGCFRPGAGLLRLEFESDASRKVPVRVAGMAGYQLSLDGQPVHRGPEWSDRHTLFADALTLDLKAGRHTLEILLWHFGPDSGLREMSPFAGFALWPDDARDTAAKSLLATGTAPYRACRLPGCTAVGYHMSCMAAPRLAMDWNVAPEPWLPAETIAESMTGMFAIHARALPPMREKTWTGFTLRAADENRTGCFREGAQPELRHLADGLAAGESVELPPHRCFRLLWDLGDYLCAFAEFELAGGKSSMVEVLLTESLFEETDDWDYCYKHPVKGNRSQVDGKFVAGTGDRFTADGAARQCRTLDWDAGRYLLLRVETGDTPLTLSGFRLRETGYPLALDGEWQSADPAYQTMVGLCRNSLLRCMHATYMDCPHYEQMMYAGDGRLEMLGTYILSRDRRLPRKALLEFAASQTPEGFTLARYPSREAQLIPPFALWFATMVCDYAQWTDEPELIAWLLPRVRRVMEAFARCREKTSGLILNPAGWNFYDWADGWKQGEPPGGGNQPGALLNCHYVYTLELLAQLEAYMGCGEQSEAWQSEAQQLRAAVRERFFVPARGLLSDDAEHRCFSQHTQALALLGGLGGRELYDKLFEPGLTGCTIYFSHYLFEAAKLFGDGPRCLKLLEFWRNLSGQGFLTTPERPEPSRSDCHGWGSHPLYHLATGLAGIRPAAFGGRTFTVRPLDAPDCPDFHCVLGLPAGEITVIRRDGRYAVRSRGDLKINDNGYGTNGDITISHYQERSFS